MNTMDGLLYAGRDMDRPDPGYPNEDARQWAITVRLVMVIAALLGVGAALLLRL